MIARIVLILLACGIYTLSFTQQLPLLYNHHDFYGYSNPAAVDSRYFLERRRYIGSINLFHNKQWLGSDIQGTPMTSGIDSYFSINRKWNLGGGILLDEAGAIETWQFYGRVSRNLVSGRTSDLLLGLGILTGGISVDPNKIDESDRNDPVLTSDVDNSFLLRVSSGLYGRQELDQGLDIIAGISMVQFRSFNENKALGQTPHFYGKLAVIYETKSNASKKSNRQFVEGTFNYNYIPSAPENWELIVQYYAKNYDSQLWTTYGLGYNNRGILYGKFQLLWGKFGLGFNVGIVSLSSSLIKEIRNDNPLELRLIYNFST